MSKFPHDEFAKDLLKLLLEAFGIIEIERPIGSEVRAIDCYFSPHSTITLPIEIGLFQKLSTTNTAYEVYRNPISDQDIRVCLAKLFDLYTELYRRNKRDKLPKPEKQELPQQWIITPTLAPKTLQEFGAIMDTTFAIRGVYNLPKGNRTGIVIVHQLPIIPDNLWLRALGRGKVQTQALEEIYTLPLESSYRQQALALISALKINLESNSNRSKPDQELIMSLLTSPAYLEHVRKLTEQGRTEGKVEEAQSIALRQLTKKLGDIPADAQARINRLSIEQIHNLIDALLDFESINDLVVWFESVTA